jgi:hypothetical protein
MMSGEHTTNMGRVKEYYLVIVSRFERLQQVEGCGTAWLLLAIAQR